MALILTLEERIECSGGIHTIADHLHGKKVIGGALIVIERSAGRSGLLVVLLIEADLGADEHKAVLTLPELEQIAAVLIVEIDSDSVIVHYGEACCKIVQRVETELLLPGVNIVNIEELALGIILVRKQSAFIERAQTELSSDRRIDIIELTEKVVLALVGDSLLESRDIIGVLEVVRSAVDGDYLSHAVAALLNSDNILMLCRSDYGVVAGLDDSVGANVALAGIPLCARGRSLCAGNSAVGRRLGLRAVGSVVCTDVHNRILAAAGRCTVIVLVGLFAGRKSEDGSKDKKQC